MNIKKPSKSKAQLKSKGKSVSLQPKGPRNNRPRTKGKKSVNPTPFIFIAILVIGGLFAYGPIMNAMKEPEPIVEAKVVKKAKPVKKKKVVKKEAPKVVVEIPKVKAPKKEAPKEVLFSGEIKHYNFNDIVNDRCISCHGKEGEKIEGKFDFKKLLASGSTNPKAWKIIYDEILMNNMPPEEEEPLSIEEKEVLLAEIKKIASKVVVGNKTRALTPNEIENTLVDLFAVDSSVYNPFTKLHQSYSHTEFYTTQENIITPYYLNDLYTSLEDAVKSYVSLRTNTKPLNLGVTMPGQSHRVIQKGNTSDLRWEFKGLLNPIEFKDRNAGKKKASRNKKSEGPESGAEETLEKFSLPAGTYVFSFTGEALNMKPDKYNKNKYGQELIDSFKRYIPKDGYSLPVDFFIVPPGQADAFGKTQQITTIDVKANGKKKYEVKFTLNRRAGLACKLGLKFHWDGGVAKLIAEHRNKNADRKAYEEVLEKEIKTANYPFAQIRMSNMKIRGPLNVKVNDYSLKDDEKLNDRAIGQKFKNLHEDTAIRNNTVYTYIFNKLKQSKMDEEESFRVAMMSFFLSPDFLTVGNNKKDKQAYARYISYAFHKSHPSPDFLTQFAGAQKSANADELSKWIVNHSNFERFLNNFTYQWLNMEEILAASPEEAKFGLFHEKNFFEAYKVEASKFFLHLFSKNIPIKEMVTANYSFINEDLKNFYENGGGNSRYRSSEVAKEVYDVKKETFKKHIFADKEHGGLLTMGAFLTATGNGVDGLPIRRSTWILENLFDSPLPPPPEEIDLTNFESKHSEDLKKKLESHSQDPACYGCHKRIDPLAIIMDRFDTMGGVNRKHSRDAVMVNGKKLSNVTDLKKYIGENDEVLARAFTKKLLEYTLGRQLYIQDEPSLKRVIDENRESGFKTRNLLSSILKNFFL